SCPTCGSSEPSLRYHRGPDGKLLASRTGNFCTNAWHTRGLSAPTRHTPRIGRTHLGVRAPERLDRGGVRVAPLLYDGLGNALLVRGCSGGAEVADAETFAAHVGWPADAVHTMLALAGI